jgi:hypothetical protein
MRGRWGSVILGLVLFCTTVLLLGYAVDKVWFREDDLGIILNGLIRSWADFKRVCLADCRSFITPVNYQRTIPNVFSALWRPVQNWLFACLYPFAGVNVWYYYLAQVVLHALNAVLLFVLCNFFMARWLAFVAGAMLAFYPHMDWLLWIGTAQNSLSLLFLLLMLIILVVGAKRATQAFKPARPEPVEGYERIGDESMSGFRIPFIYQLLAALCYFLSLLSRESGIFLPVWLWLGVWLLLAHQDTAMSWWVRAKRALSMTWLFFITNGVYALLRLYAFGCGTLPRTVRNLTLRFPWLQQYLPWVNWHTPAVVHAVPTIAPVPTPILKTAAKSLVVVGPSWTERMVEAIAKAVAIVIHTTQHVFDCIVNWVGMFCNLPTGTGMQRLLTVAVILFCLTFIWLAYRHHRAAMWWVVFGMLCVAWPGVVAYPCPRYLNLLYPFLIVFLLYGVGLMLQTKKLMPTCMLALLGFATMTGLQWNRLSLRTMGNERVVYQQRFTDFFAQNTFEPDANFVVISSPFVSDIQSIFQACLHNLSTVVVFDLFCTLAQRGTMGCSYDYRTSGVASRVEPTAEGFRLISQDPEYCGWWLRFSDFPIAWSEKDRAYAWTAEPYRPDVWYACSIGKFMIHDMVDADCMTDVEFVLDRRWVNDGTVFVAWNTQKGCYEVVELDL